MDTEANYKGTYEYRRKYFMVYRQKNKDRICKYNNQPLVKYRRRLSHQRRSYERMIGGITVRHGAVRLTFD